MSLIIALTKYSGAHAHMCSAFFNGNLVIVCHTHAENTHIYIINVSRFNVNK